MLLFGEDPYIHCANVSVLIVIFAVQEAEATCILRGKRNL